MDCWTHCSHDAAVMVEPGCTASLFVSSAFFHGTQSVTQLMQWRNCVKSACVYYAVLRFSL